MLSLYYSSTLRADAVQYTWLSPRHRPPAAVATIPARQRDCERFSANMAPQQRSVSRAAVRVCGAAVDRRRAVATKCVDRVSWTVRTNNDVEGWHRRLNNKATRGQLQLYVLIPMLFKEASLLPLQVKLVNEKKLQRRMYVYHMPIITMLLDFD